ncbi:hypothetical protein GCM10011591_15880 [Nocardia camponoti]|uniref:Uncharacterized protein n=1 Tax=Nocardia camponoti TaxID=1616106 RepID=A0A917QEE8_9NOCA|nr:hypothetical protein GCM10011591_15880 [Nocardia camponoti]
MPQHFRWDHRDQLLALPSDDHRASARGNPVKNTTELAPQFGERHGFIISHSQLYTRVYIPALRFAYLEAGITQLAKDYGSLDAYLRTGLGLSDATITALRTKLVG